MLHFSRSGLLAEKLGTRYVIPLQAGLARLGKDLDALANMMSLASGDPPPG